MNIKDYFKIFIESINKCFSNEQKNKLEKTTQKLFMEQPINQIEKTQSFILSKIDVNDIVIQQKERYRFSSYDDIQINWNNLGYLGVYNLKNLDLLKIQRMTPTSFNHNKIEHNMTQNEIYSIRKVEDGKTGIKGYIYILKNLKILMENLIQINLI